MNNPMREMLEYIIRSHTVATEDIVRETALHIIKYLDEELDIRSNGWLDNDEEAIEYIESFEDNQE